MNPVVLSAIIAGCASVIVGILTLIGVLISNSRANRNIQARLETAQAVTDTKIEELTREVRMHNDFARRIPVLEEQNKVQNHRIADLEEFHKVH